VVRVRRSSTSTSASSTCFEPDKTGTRYQALYEEYTFLTRNNPGWNLTTIRDLTARERRYWFDVAIVRSMRGETPA
jgi:hypothetical protein